jgi:hypothetical protein
MVELAELRDLEELTVSGKGITEDALKFFHCMQNLKTLRLFGTKISKAVVQHLKKHWKKCEIIT